MFRITPYLSDIGYLVYLFSPFNVLISCIFGGDGGGGGGIFVFRFFCCAISCIYQVHGTAVPCFFSVSRVFSSFIISGKLYWRGNRGESRGYPSIYMRTPSILREKCGHVVYVYS